MMQVWSKSKTIIFRTPSEKHPKTMQKALDKALPQRDFLQVIDVPTKKTAPYELSYDEEWLKILQKTNDLFSITETSIRLPKKGPGRIFFSV